MKILSSDITLLHGRTTGIAALPDEATDQPLLVFVHGGGATSRSFDIPGHSQILRAARNGFPAYALDRPGYGGSEPLGLPADSDTGCCGPPRNGSTRPSPSCGSAMPRPRPGSS